MGLLTDAAPAGRFDLRLSTQSVRGMVCRRLLGVGGHGPLFVDASVRASWRRLSCGEGVRLGRFAEVSGRVRLGDGVVIHPHVLLRAQDGFISIGRGSTVNPFCAVNGAGGVQIGELVSIAAHVVIVAEMKRFGDAGTEIKHQGATCSGIVIGDGAWTGTHAVILDGVSLGRGAVVGAGAVVTADVPAMTVVAGVPARQIGVRDDPT